MSFGPNELGVGDGGIERPVLFDRLALKCGQVHGLPCDQVFKYPRRGIARQHHPWNVHRSGSDREGACAGVQRFPIDVNDRAVRLLQRPLVSIEARPRVQRRQDLHGGKLPRGQRLEDAVPHDKDFGVLYAGKSQHTGQVDRGDVRL